MAGVVDEPPEAQADAARDTESMRAPFRRLSLRAWMPYAVLAITLSLTVVGTAYVVRTNDTRDVLRFRAAAEETQQLIDIRLNTYIELLRAGAALFAATDNLTGDEFRAFVRGLRVHERYPGIQAIGFAVRIEPARLRAVESQLAAIANAHAQVWPPGPRDEYVVTLLLEPLDRDNRLALGYDMATDPARRVAMERAHDTGEPAASGKVTLAQPSDASEQAGFVIFMPVYRHGAPASSLEERRGALIGYVFSPYRVDELLSGILAAGTTEPLELAVYDGSTPSDASRMSASWPHDPLANGDRQVTHRLDVAGRPWTIAFAPARGFSRSFPWLAPIALIAGTLLSLAVFGVSLVQLRAWAQVRASEDALRRSESRLRELVGLERDARDEAQAANRAKDEFLATLSHELRTPLNAMLGWLSMLRSGKLAPDRRDNALEVVERNAHTQARLIEDLLDVSRIMTGKVRLDLHPLQLGPIANTVLEALRPSADAKGVRLHTSIAANVPNLMGDAARLQQIVWNLLSNAIKFTPPGGDVYLDLQAQHAHVELRVRDTGVGIAPEFLPHVFERFRQANSSTTRAHSGVGLGLAIVRHLVELHGGAIEAHSDGRDRGALFVARFPATSSRDASRTTPPQEQHGPVLEGVRVLVVEDDADMRELLTQALSASGASVLPAGSADEALELLRRRGVDVLVSDIGMPDVDGYALMRRVRTLPEPAGRVPAIALTAYARPQDRDDAIDAGFQVHIAKPVQIEALEEALVSLTRHP